MLLSSDFFEQNSKVRRNETKFTVGYHCLEIRQGRFTRTDRAIALCMKCGSGSVEDEDYLLFHCPIYQHVRVTNAELLELLECAQMT
jgi:hypothetical protein